MITFVQRLILFLAIVSQLVLGAGMVLCMESDGSMQLELSSAACCEPEPGHEQHGEEGHEACARENRDCGGCTDQDLVVVEVPKDEHTLPPLVALPQVSATVWRPADRLKHTLRTPRPPAQRLARLKSVVLRC